eukprot:SAG25_NODE_1906_length_2158_cov_2.636717_2_plen_95_part_00
MCGCGLPHHRIACPASPRPAALAFALLHPYLHLLAAAHALLSRTLLRARDEAFRPHARGSGAASVASFEAAVLAEIYLCNACSCQEELRRHGRA